MGRELRHTGAGTGGGGRLTQGEPSREKRHGSSRALVIPMCGSATSRGPPTTGRSRGEEERPLPGEGWVRGRARFRALGRACTTPEQSSAGGSTGRPRPSMTSTPSMASSVRMRTGRRGPRATARAPGAKAGATGPRRAGGGPRPARPHERSHGAVRGAKRRAQRRSRVGERGHRHVLRAGATVRCSGAPKQRRACTPFFRPNSIACTRHRGSDILWLGMWFDQDAGSLGEVDGNGTRIRALAASKSRLRS